MKKDKWVVLLGIFGGFLGLVGFVALLEWSNPCSSGNPKYALIMMVVAWILLSFVAGHLMYGCNSEKDEGH